MKVSIIMPVYNLPELTKRALNSIPFDEDLEVVVVDDGSTDDMSFIKDYPVKYIRNEKNINVGHARNVALDNISGDYLIGLDNDDYFYTDEFRKALKELDGTDMVFINARINDGYVFEIKEKTKYHYCAFWSKFIKTSLIGDTRCKEIKCASDYFFNKELMAKPHTEKYTNIVAYHYNFPRENSLIWNKDHGIC